MPPSPGWEECRSLAASENQASESRLSYVQDAQTGSAGWHCELPEVYSRVSGPWVEHLNLRGRCRANGNDVPLVGAIPAERLYYGHVRRILRRSRQSIRARGKSLMTSKGQQDAAPRGGAITTKREAVFPACLRALYDTNRYEVAIRSGDLQVGSREDGSPEPAFEHQVRLAFESLAAVLEAAGCTLDDVVDVTTYHTASNSRSRPSRVFSQGP